MSDKKYKNFNNEKWILLLIGVMIGIAVTFLSLFAFSAVYTLTDIDEYYNAVFATLSLIIGVYFGAMYSVSKIKEKGFINGMFIGIAVFLIVFLISIFMSENYFSLSSIFHFVCCLLSGGISGIIRVNRETNKKYLK